MCVIIYKPVGKSLHQSELVDASMTNSHGAGYMYRQNGKIVIQKGFMTVDLLLASLEQNGFLADEELIPDREVALHFRIATSGGVTPGRTHPFPIHRSYKIQERLHQEVESAVMHNGVIGSLGAADYSDTQELTATVFHHVFHDSMSASELKKAIEDVFPSISFYSSKFLFFTPKMTYWLGSFTDEDGIKYSNLTHRNTYASSAYVGRSHYPAPARQQAWFPQADNAVINTFRRVWQRLGGSQNDLRHMLPHVKLVTGCWESNNCLTCQYFRYRKQTARCLVWAKYKDRARRFMPELTEIIALLNKAGEDTNAITTTEHIQESL